MRLSQASLGRLPASVRKPGYDRGATRIGMVHLGIGAFHRAHQAVVIEDRLEAGESGWSLAAASLRSPDTRDALAPQDWLYTMAVRSAAGEDLRVIGAIREGHVAPENPEALVARLAHPDTRIVSLTVTEKGYCHDPATGTLNEAHPDILADLAAPGRPKTAIGFLAAALERRRSAGLQAFTVLCCDNLPANGRTVKRVLDRFCALRDPELGRWVADHVLCPSSMVDRIVPATTDEDRARIAASLGMEDRWPVMTEPFLQWVIEDRFALGRPDLAAAGVTMVGDVTPFEHMKLRLLNGSHSTMAYLGYLAGHETIAETIGVPAMARLVRRLMDEEITPTLSMPAGTDLDGYKDALIARFRNPALRHRTAQIAMDGSQKLPQRLLGTVRDRLAAGAPIGLLAVAVAGWMRFAMGEDEAGQQITLNDPMAERILDASRLAGRHAGQLASALMGIREIFGVDLPQDPRFTGPVTAALASLLESGAAATIDAASRA
ncbi:MAG: mannitol dehydrogenase family protein [Beijerinckiaceae bacterium]|nr:mannitol dehydrogenase family protein [Beijerinckiaceae bacterium]MCZ8301319.1 mannitol dehydrogenase family protein [Beijerinckiaceae bacterium]